MDLAKLSVSELLERIPVAPQSILGLSARMKHVVNRVSLNEGQRDEILLLLSRGIYEPREYLRVSLPLLTALENVSEVELATSYAQCLIAKAMSEVFYKLVPRLRNEHARLLFLQAISNLSEVVHHPPSQEINRFFSIRRSSEKRRIVELVSEQVAQLVDQRWLPESEFVTQLEEANADFLQFVESMEDLTGYRRGRVGRYQEDPQICSFFDPWYGENTKTFWWGIQYYPVFNVLNVQPQYFYFYPLRRGLLAREAARLFTPRILEKTGRIYEQADYCSYKILRNQFEKEFWMYARHGLRTESKEYDGIHYYEEWESIIGNDFIKRLFSRMESISRFRSSLDLTEYEAIIDALALRPKPAMIKETELKILRLLCMDPWASLTEIAQKVGLSMPTAEKIFNDLWIRANIWFSVLIDKARIGIPDYLVILNNKPGKATKIIDLIWEIPYCGRIYQMYSPSGLLVHFNIPTSYEWFLNQYLSQLDRMELIEGSKILRIEDLYYNFNLRYYELGNDCWNVPWDEWGLWLKEFLCGKGWFSVLHNEEKKNREQVKIDRVDLQILNFLRLNSRMPYSEIGRILEISGAYVGQKVRRLLNLNVVKPTMGSYRVGLDEAAFVAFDCNEDISKALAVALNELPMWQGFRVSGDFEGLAGMIFVPTGELEELFKALHEYLIEPGFVNRCYLNMIEKWSSRRREPPVELYSDESGWLFESEKYLDRLKTGLRPL